MDGKWKLTDNAIRRKIREIFGRGPQSIRQIADIATDELGAKVSTKKVHTLLHAMGLQPYGRPFAEGYHVRCADGHLVASFGEARIDNFLSKVEIKHWPHWQIVGTGRSVDFWLPDIGVGIEYVGLIGHPAYDKRISEKRKIYNEWAIPILWVYPDTPIDATLITKITQILCEYREEREVRQKVLLK